MKLLVRAARKEDALRIVELVNSQREIYSTVFSRKEMDGIGIGRYKAEDFEDNQKNNGLVAIEENEIVGYTHWYMKPNNIAWVGMLEVDPRHYRKGVGQALISRVERDAKKQGAKGIALEAQKKASWAVNFYKKQNYTDLSWEVLNNEVFTGTLKKPPLRRTHVFGKRL